MSILGRLLRYVQFNGYPLSSEEITPKRNRRLRERQRAQTIEQMEPRILFTTVFGSEIFQYADAHGNIVRAQVNGNTTVAELIGAVQSADDGTLLFGNLGGTVVSSGLNGRAGLIIGNGSVEVSGDERNGARTNITDPLFGNNLSVGANANEINITGLSSNASGLTFGFNVYQPGDNIPDTTTKRTVIQVLQFNNSTGAATVYDTLDPADNPATTFDTGTVTGTDGATIVVSTATAIQAAAFDPHNPNILYFVAKGTGFTGNGTVNTVESLWAYDLNAKTTTEMLGNFGGDLLGKNEVEAITITPTSPTTSDMWVFQKNGNATTGQPAASLYSISFNDDPTTPQPSVVNTDNINNFLTVTEGFLANPPVVTAITGISFIPGDSTHLYAVENTGATSRLLRISTTQGTATDWGSLTDQVYARLHPNGNPPIAGNDLLGLTWNPNITNPFTGTNGVLEATDTATNDLMFIDGRLRINAGDVYSVYTNQADMSSSITFQAGVLDSKGKFTSKLYQGNFGDFSPEHVDGFTMTVPGNIGGAYLGFLGNLINGNTTVPANPFLSGTLTSSVGIFPSIYSTDPTGIPTSTLTPGLTVGYSLETFANVNPTATIANRLLGQSFNSVHGLAISNDGTIAVMNTDSFGNFVAGDQLAFVNPTSGAINSDVFDVQDSGGNALTNIEGLAYGSVNLDGTQQLYAIYDLHDGNGPTFGTLDLDSTTDIATFNVIGALGLGADARVFGMAFSPGSTGFDSAHQGLFVAYDADQLDSDPTNTLAQIDPTTGLTTGDIGTILDPEGNLAQVGSMTFDGAGRLLVQDSNSGRLLNLQLDTTTATATFGTTVAESAAGGLNPTIGGIAFDITTSRFFAIDNMTGTTNGVANATRSSAVLMVLKDFSDPTTIATNDSVNLGKFLFDGTVTGKVFVSGSMDTFYAGWLITGDATGGVTQWNGPAVDLTNNFNVAGDVRNVLSLGSIGTDGQQVVNGIPQYTTGTTITAAGKIGNVNSDGMIYAVIHASDLTTGIPNITDGTSLTGFGGLTVFGTGTTVTSGCMTVNGNATINAGLSIPALVNDSLTLTANAGDTGSVFSTTVQSIDNFTASFVYSATGGTDEGAAFVLENGAATALGASGTGLGYQGLTHSAAILFNINPVTGAPETGLGLNGNLNFTSTGNVDITSGDPISVYLNYDGSVLTETLLDQVTQDTFTTSYVVDLATILGSHTALAGFTGATTNGATQTIAAFQFNGGGTQQTEVQKWTVDTKLPAYLFGAGNLVDLNGVSPFSNGTFNNAQYLGTVRNYVSGQPDVIDLTGEIQGISHLTGAIGPDPVDYYGISLVANQTVNVTVQQIFDQYESNLGFALTAPLGDVHFGIFDPDGRLIATDYSDVDALGVAERSINFTADRPGVYRVAIGLFGDSGFTGAPTVIGDAGYRLTVTGAIGNTGIGAVVSGGNLILAGNPLNAAITTVSNPSIIADFGDVGAVVGGQQRIANTTGRSILGLTDGFLRFGAQSSSRGYSLLPGAAAAGDITVSNGNLVAMVAGDIGLEVTNGFGLNPDINVSGIVGLIQATDTITTTPLPTLGVTFDNAAGGNIQRINAAGDLVGIYRTNKGIGTVTAAQTRFGTADTEFHADVDRSGNDGIIDYIGVTGDFGTLATGGPAIETGPGGNVRFIDVTGTVWQDTVFSVNGTTTGDGSIIHAAGQTVTFQDDSGATVTITPGSVENPGGGVVVAGKTTPITTPGQLITRTYGVRGSGGVVIMDIRSNTGANISIAPGGNGRGAEIGHIQTGSATILGVPLVQSPLTGAFSYVPVVVTTDAGTIADSVNITSSGNAKVDVFDINDNGVPTNLRPVSTLDSISNTTGGDIGNIEAWALGTVFNHGSIGSIASAISAIIPIETFADGVYPFVQQHMGVAAMNIGSLTADKSIGNVFAQDATSPKSINTGTIGTITADKDGIHTPGFFEGINGPIVADGWAQGTLVLPGTNIIASTSITQINIGQGILSSGSGAMSRAGIYAYARILGVSGSSADIRGDIVSENLSTTAFPGPNPPFNGTGGIGNITLVNGSIINANIEVTDLYSYASELPTAGVTLTGTPGSTLDHPNAVIGNVTLTGNGGIIGSFFVGASIGNISVASTGFGILNSAFTTLGDGVINSIVAGGYGIRDVIITAGARLNTLSAIGGSLGLGVPTPISNYEASVRLSEHNVIDPFTNVAPNALTDLDIFLNGDGTIDHPLDPAGLTTGVIENVHGQGQEKLGNVTAYDILTSVINFASSTGNVTVGHDINGLQLISGGLGALTVAGDVSDVDIEIAGKIGNVSIAGSFLDDGNTALLIGEPTLIIPSQIIAKGPSGDLGNFKVAGDMTASLAVEGVAGNITVGTPGVGGSFSGSITIHGNQAIALALGMLQFYGSITGGTIILNGNVGTINVAQDLANLAQDLVVNGNLAILTVGTDKNISGSAISAPVTINGNLGAGTVTGFMSSVVTVRGNIGTFAVVSDPVTVGGDLITNTGGLSVGGTLGTLTVTGGNMDGQILVGGNITGVTITNGNLGSDAQVTSALGNITKITITNGSFDGSVFANNGAITTVTVTGAGNGVSDTGLISARSVGTITTAGDFDGTLNVTTTLGTLTVGGIIDDTAVLTIGSFTTLTLKGDFAGTLTSGISNTTENVTIGGNDFGSISLVSPASITINGNTVAGAIIATTGSLTKLSVKGAMIGTDVFVDGLLGTFTAGSMTDSVVTSGMGITSFTVTGSVATSLVQTGLARGSDHQFGTGDLGEQPRMADITTLTIGLAVGSIFAAGGNIGTFKSKGTLTNTSISAGLVLDGGDIQDVIDDATPLADSTRLDNARADATLLHGSFTSATVGATGITMINSALTAGVSPGADGDFLTAADNNVSSSVTGGISKFGTVKAGLDGTSKIFANAASTGATPVTVVKYTLDGTTNSIISADPILNAAVPVIIASPNHPMTYTLGGQSITIKVTGPATATVKLYDNGSLVDGVADSLVIDGGGSTSGVTVTVTTTGPGAFDLGRVLATDGTIVTAFTFNGDIKGDALGGPALYIDSDITTLSFRDMPNSTTWTGLIGGNVTTLTMRTQGPGLLRIGGKVTTYNVTSSLGNPLIQQLGSISLVGGLTQLAFDPNSSNTFGVDANGNLVTVDPTTGATVTVGSVSLPVSGQVLTLSGLTFDSNDVLFGVANINNLQPVKTIGSITTTGDSLRAIAVNSQGVIYAVDNRVSAKSNGLSLDTLVTLDPTTGVETIVGILQDPLSNHYTNNVLAIAFDKNDNLIVLLNDKDGNSATLTTANGVALGRIATTDPTGSGFVRVSNPTNAGGALAPVLLAGPDTDNFTGLAVDSNNQIWAVSNNGTADVLNTIAITGSAGTAAVTITAVGNIQISGTTTSLLGIGFDDQGTLTGLNVDAGDNTTRDLVAIDTLDPTTSAFLTATPNNAGLITNDVTGFTISKDGLTSYAFTTDPNNGGVLFSSIGAVPTLGTISTSGPTAGQFTQLLPLVQDDVSTPLAGTVRSIAIDDSGDVFVVTSNNILAEFNAIDGSLQNNGPLGLIRDNISNNILDITQLAFDDAGNLVGLNAQQNRLVVIDTNDTFTFNGQDAVSASAVTNFGSVDAADLTTFTFDTDTGTFISYSQASSSIVSILSTAPNTLGGVIANTFGTVNLPGQFGGRIVATNASTAASITTVKITGFGTFSGDVETPGSIGTVTTNGAIFVGAIVADGDITTASILGGGAFGVNGVLSAGGKLGTFTFDGKGISNFAGTLLAGRAGTITIKGATFAGSLIEVSRDVTTLFITGTIGGVIQIGSVTTFTASSNLIAGASVLISSDSGTVKLAGSDDGSTFLALQGITTLTVGNTLSGVVAVRRNVGTANLTNVFSGVFTVGGDIKTLAIAGNVTDSVLSSGVWIGNDGVYNTTDDVIFGGSITSATVKGIWQDSVLAAGVLPGLDAPGGQNNIPTDYSAYTGVVDGSLNGSAAVEAGGIAVSRIAAITFLQMVVSTSSGSAGLFSALVTADGIGTVKDPVNSLLTQITLTNPIGVPELATDDTGAFLITHAETDVVTVAFTEPLDPATIAGGDVTIQDITDPSNPIDINDLSFVYSTQVAPDGSIQGLITITSPSGFNASTSLQLTINSKLTDRTGTRSALFDFNQDGTIDTTEDPFGGGSPSTVTPFN